MKWLRLLLSKTLSKRPALTIVLTLAMTFVLALFMSGTHAVDGFEQGYRQRLIDTYGTQDVVFFCSPVDKENIKADCINNVGAFEIYGKIQNDDSVTPICLGYADNAAVAMHKITAVEGRMPQNNKEVTLEIGLKKIDGFDVDVGDVINLIYCGLDDNFEFANKTELSLTVVGFTKNYSSIHSGALFNEYDKAVLPNILLGDSLSSNKIKTYSLQLNSDENQDELISYLNNEVIFASKYYKNAERYNNVSLSKVGTLVKSTTMSLFILISIFCGLITLLLQFLFMYGQQRNINISEQLGITRLQCALFVICLNVAPALFAVLPGCLIGVGLSVLFSKFLTRTFQVTIANTVSFETVILSVILFVCVNVVCAIICVFIEKVMTSSSKKQKHPAHMPKTSSPYKLMSYKMILCNPVKYIAVSAAVAICFTMMCASMIYKTQFGEITQNKNNQYDYTVVTSMVSYDQSTLNIPIDYNAPIGNVYDKFKAVSENALVDNYEIHLETYANILTFDSTQQDKILRQYLPLTYNGGFENYGYADSLLYGIKINACEPKDFEKFKACDVCGEINTRAIADGTEFAIVFSESRFSIPEYASEKRFYEDMKSLVGSEFTISQVASLKDVLDKSSGQRHDFNIKLGAVVLVPKEKESEIVGRKSYAGSFFFSYPELKNKNIYFNSYEWNIKLVSLDSTDIFEPIMMSALSESENYRINSDNQNNAALKQTFLMLDSVTGGLTIIMCGFALVFILINYGQNILTKKHLYIQLYTIGASPEQINIILLTDYLITVILAVLLAVIPIAILSYYMYLFNEIHTDVINIVAKSFVLPVAIASALCIPFYSFNKKWILQNIGE